MEMPMPTELPPRRPRPYANLEPQTRALLFASLMLLSVLVLVCHKFYPVLPGYSLAPTSADLQLSP
jgi:hypothetical protein